MLIGDIPFVRSQFTFDVTNAAKLYRGSFFKAEHELAEHHTLEGICVGTQMYSNKV
jgi:hypothetical protein